MIVTRWDRTLRRPVHVEIPDPGAIDQDGLPQGGKETSLALPSGRRHHWSIGLRGAYGSMALLRRAIREDWAIPPETRQAAIDFCKRLIASGEPKAGLGAVLALIAADNVNVKRESVDSGERGQDVSAATDLLRSLAKDHPELYGQLCKALAERQRTQLPAPPTDAPEA